jgi:hypothetical protein
MLNKINIYIHILYNIGGAYASKTEHILGSIQEDYIADFTFVQPNIIDNHELLLGYTPELVMIGGDIVYSKQLYDDKKYNINNSAVSISPISTTDTPSSSSLTLSTLNSPLNYEGNNYIPGKNGPFNWISSKISCSCCR